LWNQSVHELCQNIVRRVSSKESIAAYITDRSGQIFANVKISSVIVGVVGHEDYNAFEIGSIEVISYKIKF